MINQNTLKAIANKIAANTLTESLIAQLRTEFAQLHFTYCSDDDICGVLPVLEYTSFNLYLIDGSEHCLSLTTDYQTATGVVVAEIYADETP
jgi:hypothetical protein